MPSKASPPRRREVTPDLTVKNVFVGKNVLSDTFGLLALKNIFKALRTAVKDGKNIEAREQMMLASLAAGCAFGAAGTAAAHAIQYPVGNETHTPHGMGVALLMPYVMEFNRPNCVAAFAEIGRAIGLSGTRRRTVPQGDRRSRQPAEGHRHSGDLEGTGPAGRQAGLDGGKRHRRRPPGQQQSPQAGCGRHEGDHPRRLYRRPRHACFLISQSERTMTNTVTIPTPKTGPAPFPIPTDLWIGGKWVEAAGKKRVDVFDPSTGKKITDVADCDANDALAAVDAADKAAAGWAATTPRQRAEILRKCYEKIVANIEWLAYLISLENGKALPDARAEVLYAAEFYRWYAEEMLPCAGRNRHGAGQRRAHPGAVPAHRHRAADHALELSGGDGHPQDRAGAGGRLHRGAEARHRNAAHRLCRRPDHA